MLTSINSKLIRDDHHQADTYLKMPQNHHSQKKKKNQLVIQTLQASRHHQLLADELRKKLSL